MASGLTAIDISKTGLSSAAIRFELKVPHTRHRCIIAHSPPLRAHIPERRTAEIYLPLVADLKY